MNNKKRRLVIILSAGIAAAFLALLIFLLSGTDSVKESVSKNKPEINLNESSGLSDKSENNQNAKDNKNEEKGGSVKENSAAKHSSAEDKKKSVNEKSDINEKEKQQAAGESKNKTGFQTTEKQQTLCETQISAEEQTAVTPQKNDDIQSPEKPQKTPSGETAQEQQEHVHQWEEKVKIIHHDAVTESVKVIDSEEYYEPIYEEVPIYEQIPVYICNVCGQEFESEKEHSKIHLDLETMTNPFSYRLEFRQGEQIGTQTVETGSIFHPEESHMETITVREAYDEEVHDGYVCYGCGATK